MSSKKPPPLFPPVRPRKLCPVCGKASYSRQGIHPQCAAKRADDRRVQALPSLEQAVVHTPTERTAWHKLCPECGAQVHIRRETCQCGHSFARPRTKSTED